MTKARPEAMMSETIGNPLSWSAQEIGAVGRHIGAAAGRVGHGDAGGVEMPAVRHLAVRDLRECLRKGAEDFAACRTDVAFLALLYPVIGILLVAMTVNRDLVPLIFPVMAGFALVGPVAAVGLYEMSRRRERGEEPGWADALTVTRAPSFGAILALGLMLLGVFVVWILTAHAIWFATLGPERPASLSAFLHDAFTTGAGWAMIVIGCGVGALFALGVLVASVVAFPLLLDRDVGLPVAVVTSARVARANPVPILAWGLIVAAGLVLGSIPLFLGLIVVMPILGHATWHLYRRAVVAEPAPGAPLAVGAVGEGAHEREH
jgi:uncharacterized membrane protein